MSISHDEGSVKDLSEYGDDALAEMIDGSTRLAEHHRRLAFGARGELLARLLERGGDISRILEEERTSIRRDSRLVVGEERGTRT